MVLSKINGKKIVIGGVGTCNSLLKECYATLRFDFACCAWYTDVSNSLKNELQTAQKFDLDKNIKTLPL